MTKKILCIYIFLTVISSSFFSQELLSNLNTTWSTVLPGKVITQPVKTSYGFCLVTDSKSIQSFSNDGVLLWEKNIQRTKNPIITTILEDFLVVVSENGHKLSLLNPSGGEIWNRTTDYEIKNQCFEGRDGRFFVYGNSIIECYGINGILKWNIDVKSNIADLGIKELPDGSLILFLSELRQRKSVGLRLSPFGEILEEIIFSGEVSGSEYNTDGIFLTFTDGTAGFFSLSSEGKAENKWVLNKSSNSTEAFFMSSYDKKDVFYVIPGKNKIEFNQIESTKGIIKSKFTLNNINFNELQLLTFSENIFIADNKNAFLLSTTGKELWSGKMPELKSESWNYLILTNSNNLVFCCNNWSLKSYSIYYSTKKNIPQITNYKTFYNIDESYNSYAFVNSFSPDFISENRIIQLRNGNYSSKEIQWSSECQNAISAYLSHLKSSNFGTRIDNSVFDEDTKNVNQFLKQISLFGTTDYSRYNAKLLKTVKNTSFIATLLSGIDFNGYDPEGEILSALEYLSSQINPKNEFLVSKICDAVYSICKFMGRPAFNKKGKSILSNFMFPSYSNTSRKYARDVLTKIKELDI